jgi:tetratricopeptide (TPR) repeat protein
MHRFDEALFWYRRATEAAQESDASGGVDHENWASIFRGTGIVHAELGNFEEALAWLDKAVSAGQMSSRIDHQGLSKSLHGVGDCHLKLGRPADALPWLTRARVEVEQCDLSEPDNQEVLDLIKGSLDEAQKARGAS